MSSFFYNLISYADKITILSDITKHTKIFSFTFIGSEYFTGFVKANKVTTSAFSFADVYNLITEKYLDYLLFNATTPTYYYYDEEFPEANSFLTVQKFRHSTIFEFV